MSVTTVYTKKYQSPIDPVIFLNVLEPILDNRTGGIREVHLANRFVNVMRDARKLVQRCVYLNIFSATRSEEILKEILKLGAWNVLSDWLQDAERNRHWRIVSDIFQLFINLPISIEHIRSNSVPKLIRRISKRQDIDAGIRNLATDILSIWKDIVIDDHVSTKQEITNSMPEANKPSLINMASNIDPNIDLEADEGGCSSASSSSSGSYYGRNAREDKSAQNTNIHLKITKSQKTASAPVIQHPRVQDLTKLGKSKTIPQLKKETDTNVVKQKINEKEEKVEEKANKVIVEKKPQVVSPKRTHDSVDPFAAALSGGDGKSAATVPAKRPKTVKTPRTTFRSTGLDQEPDLSTTNAKKRKSITDVPVPQKRRESADSGIKPIKLEKPPVATSGSQDKTKTSPATITTTTRTPSTDIITAIMAEQSHEQQGQTSGSGTKPKPIAQPPKAAQMIESDIFMAALTGSSQPRSPAVIRRKKITVPTTTDSSTTNTKSAPVGQQPPPEITITQPQFYKEIIRTTTITTTTSDTITSSQSTLETSAITESAAEAETSKSGKKRVSWAKESELVRVQFFELEEGERAHKALGMKNSNLASLDKKMEREALEAAKKGFQKRDFAGALEPETYFTWKLIPVENAIELAVRGSKSEEKKIQQERMRNVLAEIYFTHDMIPDTPKEPDIVTGSGPETTPIIIPLTEVSDEPTQAPAPVSAQTTSLPPELAQLLQNLNKSGILPPVPQTNTGITGPGLGNTATGFGLQPGGVGFNLGPSTQQPPFGQPGITLPNQSISIRGQQPLQPGIVIPQISNTGQPSGFGNQPQMNQQGTPFPGGVIGPWNPHMASMPPPSLPGQGQNGVGGFRPRGPPPGSGFGGPRNRFQSQRFQGPQGPQGSYSQRSDRVCPFFLRGRCTFGDNCKFKHERPSTADPNSPPNESSPSSPPSNDNDRDRDYRTDRHRYSGSRFSDRRDYDRDTDQRRDRDIDKSRDRDIDQRPRDRDYRHSRFRPSSPTYSSGNSRFRSSPPTQIMDDSPSPYSKNNDNDQFIFSRSSDHNDIDRNNVEMITIPDTPTSP